MLSELLKEGLDALKECIAKGITVDMDDWFQREETGQVCSVCLAGALLYKNDNLEVPMAYRDVKYEVLDLLRRGWIEMAGNKLGLKYNYRDVIITDPKESLVDFFEDMDVLMSILKECEVGL